MLADLQDLVSSWRTLRGTSLDIAPIADAHRVVMAAGRFDGDGAPALHARAVALLRAGRLGDTAEELAAQYALVREVTREALASPDYFVAWVLRDCPERCLQLVRALCDLDIVDGHVVCSEPSIGRRRLGHAIALDVVRAWLPALALEVRQRLERHVDAVWPEADGREAVTLAYLFGREGHADEAVHRVFVEGRWDYSLALADVASIEAFASVLSAADHPSDPRRISPALLTSWLEQHGEAAVDLLVPYADRSGSTSLRQRTANALVVYAYGLPRNSRLRGRLVAEISGWRS